MITVSDKARNGYEFTIIQWNLESFCQNTYNIPIIFEIAASFLLIRASIMYWYTLSIGSNQKGSAALPNITGIDK